MAAKGHETFVTPPILPLFFRLTPLSQRRQTLTLMSDTQICLNPIFAASAPHLSLSTYTWHPGDKIGQRNSHHISSQLVSACPSRPHSSGKPRISISALKGRACLLIAAPRKAFLFHTLPPQALEMASPIVLCALTKTHHSRVLSCLSNS